MRFFVLGVESLLRKKVYSGAFPLHEVGATGRSRRCLTPGLGAAAWWLWQVVHTLALLSPSSKGWYWPGICDILQLER